MRSLHLLNTGGFIPETVTLLLIQSDVLFEIHPWHQFRSSATFCYHSPEFVQFLISLVERRSRKFLIQVETLDANLWLA